MTLREDELRAEIAYLKEQIAELTGRDDAAALCARLRLTKAEARVLAMVTKRGQRIIKADAIWQAVCEHPTGDGPQSNIVRVYVCRLRSALKHAKAPGQIRTLYGEGYIADQSLCDWVQALVAGPQEIAA